MFHLYQNSIQARMIFFQSLFLKLIFIFLYNFWLIKWPQNQDPPQKEERELD